jgi:hypothetical protein
VLLHCGRLLLYSFVYRPARVQAYATPLPSTSVVAAGGAPAPTAPADPAAPSAPTHSTPVVLPYQVIDCHKVGYDCCFVSGGTVLATVGESAGGVGE